MSEPMLIGAYQVWQLRASADGGSRLMSAMTTKEAQVREMDYWTAQLPDATLEYRTIRARGTDKEWTECELPIDRWLGRCRHYPRQRT